MLEIACDNQEENKAGLPAPVDSSKVKKLSFGGSEEDSHSDVPVSDRLELNQKCIEIQDQDVGRSVIRRQAADLTIICQDLVAVNG